MPHRMFFAEFRGVRSYPQRLGVSGGSFQNWSFFVQNGWLRMSRGRLADYYWMHHGRVVQFRHQGWLNKLYRLFIHFIYRSLSRPLGIFPCWWILTFWSLADTCSQTAVFWRGPSDHQNWSMCRVLIYLIYIYISIVCLLFSNVSTTNHDLSGANC